MKLPKKLTDSSSNDTLTSINFQNVPVACVPTGVKHLHHKAQDFDIGVYFEANGHGTIVFSDAAQAKIRETAASSNSIQAQKLAHLVDVINQVILKLTIVPKSLNSWLRLAF